MLKKINNSFIKQSVIYLSTNIINAAIPFLLLPVFSYFLSTEAYGKIAIFQLLISGLSSIIGLNTAGAASRFYFDTNNSRKIIFYNNSSFRILILSTFFSLVATFIFQKKLEDFFNLPSIWIVGAILNSAGLYIIQFRLAQFQVRNKPISYAFIQIGNSILNFIITIILICVFKLDENSRVIAILTSTFFFSIYSLYSLHQQKLISIKKKSTFYIKDNLKFGVPLVPHVFGVFLLSSIDRFFINQYYGLSEAGIYMMAVQISLGLVIFYDALNKAFVPYLFRKLKTITSNEKKSIVNLSFLLFIICISSGIISFFISPIILNFLSGDKYSSAQNLVKILCLAQSFQGMYLIITNYIFYVKKTYILSIVTIFSGSINIILMITFIPKFGIIGACYAFLISMFLRFILTWIVSQYVYPMPWLYFLNRRLK